MTERKNLEHLREVEEDEYCSSAPFRSSSANQWRCSNAHCGALLGIADPETRSCIHIFKGGTPPASDILVYNLGGVAIRQICRRCHKPNWLASDWIESPEKL